MLTRREAATVARVSLATIDRAIKRGDLHAGHTDARGCVRIVRRDLLRWLGLLMLLLVLLLAVIPLRGCSGHVLRRHPALVSHPIVLHVDRDPGNVPREPLRRARGQPPSARARAADAARPAPPARGRAPPVT